MAGRVLKESSGNVIMKNSRSVARKAPYNNANAGELLILASIEVGAFKRLAGKRGVHVKPAVA
jgi:hypothetical protein